MKTKLLILGAALTAFTLTTVASGVLLSPKAKENHIKIVSSAQAQKTIAENTTTDSAKLASPRAAANQMNTSTCPAACPANCQAMCPACPACSACPACPQCRMPMAGCHMSMSASGQCMSGHCGMSGKHSSCKMAACMSSSCNRMK